MLSYDSDFFLYLSLPFFSFSVCTFGKCLVGQSMFMSYINTENKNDYSQANLEQSPYSVTLRAGIEENN